MQPQDYQARAAALDPTRSFAVTAPAGSGKTGLLTQRVLKLLPYCDNPEEIVCITFTRKAAAEMQERIASAIHFGATQKRPAEPHEQLTWDLAQSVIRRDQECGWNLLKNTNRLRIQTIDGLCRALTQHNPVESGIGGRSQLLDQPQKVYRQAVEQALRAIESEGSLQHDLKELFTHLDNNIDSVIRFLVSLLSQRDQWLTPLLSARDARDYLEHVLSDMLGETLTELTELLLPYASDLCLLADYAGNNCLEDKPESPLCRLAGINSLPDIDEEALAQWRDFTDLLLTAKDDWRSAKGLNKNCGFPAGSDKESKALAKAKKSSMADMLSELKAIPNLLETLQLVRILPPCHYPHQQWRLLDGLTRIMPHAVTHLKLAFRSLNATDFSEVTQGALLALGDDDSPTELTMMLDYQIRHILVDEFQDTASPQLQLLERLTSGWQPGDGRTLFIVGDGMQSCYGFRDANVGIFLDARRHGIGTVPLENLDLTVNFRSQAGIVGWVNDAFVDAFPSADDISRGAVKYSPSIGFRDKLDNAAVKTHLITDAENRIDEANTVVELVQKSLRDSPEDRVAILVRNRPHLVEILFALQKAGLSWQATDIDPLANRMAIQDLISLTRAMLFPSDHNAWLALLRSPVFGLDNYDLHCVVQSRRDENKGQVSLMETLLQHHLIAGLSRDGQQILSRNIPFIRAAWLDRRRKNLRYWLEGLWVALGGPASLGDPADRDNAGDYFALLDQYEEGGSILQWEDFLQAVNMLYARASDHADPRIQVMTIHKSKGLEFETVIIPGLDKIQRSDDKQLLMWMERINQNHEKQLLLSPLAATGESDDPLYQFLRNEQKIKGALEAVRLLYVGCTRAIKQLHIIAQVKTDEKSGGVKAPSSGSLLAPLWAAVKDTANLIPASTEEARNSSPLPMIRRLPSQWQRPALVPSSLLMAYRGREFSDEENEVGDDYYRHRAARHTGTVLHRVLALLATRGADGWDANKIQSLKPSWEAQLRALGLSGQQLVDSLNKVELGVMRTLADKTAQWMLNPDHKASSVELSLWQNDQRGSKNSILDRCFIDEGVRWIIDYKSSEPNAEESVDDFIRRESEHYRPQLQRYRELFVSFPHPIKTALYFPLLSHLQEID